MYTILVIDKAGSIKQSRVTSIEDNEMYKKAGLKTEKDFKSLQILERPTNYHLGLDRKLSIQKMM